MTSVTHDHGLAGAGGTLAAELAAQGIDAAEFDAVMNSAEAGQMGNAQRLANDADGFTAADQNAVASAMMQDVLQTLGVSNLSNGAMMELFEKCRNCFNGIEAGVAARNGVELLQGSFTGGPTSTFSSDYAALLNTIQPYNPLQDNFLRNNVSRQSSFLSDE
jgi:hypothetical protein